MDLLEPGWAVETQTPTTSEVGGLGAAGPPTAVK